MEAAPNCAICNGPADPECHCESERLQIAVKQAEKRAMETRLAEIRDWVISHARQHILNAFDHLSAHRKAAHTAYLQSLPNYNVFMQYSGHPPIHPGYIAQLQTQIADAHAELKRGIDTDWRASVLRYPDVLDYFYSLIEVQIPSAQSPRVVEPPFAAASYTDRGFGLPKELKKKKKRRDSIQAPAYREEQVYSVVGRRFPGPPPVPTPPVQVGPYPPPPPSGRYPY